MCNKYIIRVIYVMAVVLTVFFPSSPDGLEKIKEKIKA